MAPAVPRLVFDLSHSTFPFCCTWPNRHKENVIIGAGSVITKETKQTSCALPEHSPNALLLQAGEEGTEGAASPPGRNRGRGKDSRGAGCQQHGAAQDPHRRKVVSLVRCHGDQCHIFLRALPRLLYIPFLGHPSVKPHRLLVPAPAGWVVLAAPRGDAP